MSLHSISSTDIVLYFMLCVGSKNTILLFFLMASGEEHSIKITLNVTSQIDFDWKLH